MRFGAVPPAEAEGAVLAHTLRLASLTLRKGTVLGPVDVARLRSAGVESVMVARLDRDDVPEDVAARELAEAVAGEGVRVGPPAAGRCNLFARAAGLVVVREADVDRLNRVHESLTLATLPPLRRVAAAELVATVKVIPFASPRAALELATGAAGRGILGVRPFRELSAVLLVTHFPGSRPDLLERARAVLAGRLEDLGGSLDRTVDVAHDVSSVAAALDDLLAAGGDAVFVLGASATLDRGDVIPAAIVRAGGTVDRLGIPVDPGNLLLMGRKGATPIVGLPGCARSPRPSGLDRVLERLAAGLDVDSDALAGLGVGGLLKEILSRPRPREDPTSGPDEDESGAAGPEPRLGAVVLAAGGSSRMGANKLVQLLDGEALVTRVVDGVLEAGVGPVVVVTGHEAARVEAALAGRPIEVVRNANWAEGMGGSLAAGIAAVEGRVAGALVCLGDMPRVATADLAALLAAFDGRAAAWVPVHQGKRGNPVLWSAAWFGRLRTIAGDRGARALLAELEDEVVEVPVPSPGVLLDVDTRAALEEMRAGSGIGESSLTAPDAG